MWATHRTLREAGGPQPTLEWLLALRAPDSPQAGVLRVRAVEVEVTSTLHRGLGEGSDTVPTLGKAAQAGGRKRGAALWNWGNVHRSVPLEASRVLGGLPEVGTAAVGSKGWELAG